MPKIKKIKAGALQFVLFIGTVIAVLLMTFVLLHKTHSLFDKKTSRTVEVIKNADLGLQYAMQQEMPINDSVQLNLQLDDGIQVTTIKSYWGIFEKYSTVSQFRKTRFVKTALVGGGMEHDFPALYLKDNNRPMIIAGKSKITGNAYLPKQGIRPGTIGGRFHQFASPVYGNLKNSSATLPALNPKLKNYLKSLLLKETDGFGQNTVRFSRNLKHTNSFESPTQHIYGDVLRLSGVDLRGNIIVKATQQIIISADCIIKDIVLVAPKITIENGFRGTLQAIASKKIQAGKRVILDYPSALVVERGNATNPKDHGEANISIEEGATVKGIVAYFENSEEGIYFPQTAVAENASVLGEIYCEKNLELKGDVIGNVTTDAFMAMENGSVYQNHLFNGTINSGLLPFQYAGLLLNKEKTIAKWLY
nr:polymer-forming cytoskeletal protein [uncultured Allomuricauda sp.]